MRLASDDDITAALARLGGRELPLAYVDEMLDHPIAGRCLRNYGLLTEYGELLGLGLSADERFWSRYYWFARFVREWQAAVRYDAGVEQQLHELLVSAEHIPVAYDPLLEVEEAVQRDAILPGPEQLNG